MTHSVIIAARRSPVAPINGQFSALAIEELAAPVLTTAIEDAGLDAAQVDELVLANALGAGGNPARIVALQAGLPESVGGLTIDRQCAGGMDAILIGDALVRTRRCDVVIAGGVESYSRKPIRYKTFADGSPPERFDQAQFTPWPDRDPDMAYAAHQLSENLGIGKAAQDAWAIESHAKAQRAPSEQIVSINGLSDDPFNRRLTKGLCERAPVAYKSITAANMSVAADGAAFLVIASESWAKENGHKGCKLLAGRTMGSDPTRPGLAPVPAIKTCLSDLGLRPEDLNAAEIMEAFSVQAIGCVRETGLDSKIVNQWGGSLARGHPIGASGAILAVQLFHQLNANPGFGLAAIASAGGLGSAILLEMNRN